jgi:opacity protein-like surface antigen
MMSYAKKAWGAVVITALLASPAAAQQRSVNLFVRSGGYNALTDLNEGGTADFNKVGFNVGGGVTVDLTEYVGVRGDFTWARNELRTGGADTGEKLDRFFYDAALQARLPNGSGLVPYAFVGAGGVTLHPATLEGDDKTKFAGTVGLGADYTLPGTGFGLFLEGQGWLFGTGDLNGALASYDRTQFEVAWSGGFSYRLPY